MEQCINCQNVYQLDNSNANIQTSFCSLDCENDFTKELERELEFYDSIK